MNLTSQVLVLEDHDIVSSMLASLLKEHIANVAIVKEKSFPAGLARMRDGLQFDLIILDVNLPGGESYGMIAILRKIQPAVRILVFTSQEEEHHALNFLSAGASGYLSKNAPIEEIGLAISTVMKDKKYMTYEVQQRLAESFFQKSGPVKAFESMILSPRETEVLNLLLEGKSSNLIARELNLKKTTVSSHKARIFEKMNVTNTIDLFKKMKLDS
ncbi:LuxR C-terminal-related transcriptional regulator [Dyadobacter diqingensis]|uniref:LuxR C-terminal-related transcriptional regulator n=1 Tax=Dyadobacter diqingensis TaxID=2938121 RepID=UPI0020C1A000|nr:response regulator transcription factor [Dyadobacter diqingensis]